MGDTFPPPRIFIAEDEAVVACALEELVVLKTAELRECNRLLEESLANVKRLSGSSPSVWIAAACATGWRSC